MSTLDSLIRAVKGEEFVYLQTHNFPDHDAVTSAFGLQYLFNLKGIKSYIIYEGTISRTSLVKLIEELKIDIKPANAYPIREEEKIIIVDGCKWNKNVTDLIGDEVGVIDHHEVASPDDVPFCDIRPELGACSSLIYLYFQEMGVEIPPDIATALLVGIEVDTAQLTRGVSLEDLNAYYELYKRADMNYVNSVLRNYIQHKDLTFYKKAIDNVIIKNRYAFCYFDEGCNQNLLGIIGDFFLALEEAEFVLLCARNGDMINFSLRSEVEYWNAAIIVQDLLKGIGFGGGHSDMAGGIIKQVDLFEPQKFLNSLDHILAGYSEAG